MRVFVCVRARVCVYMCSCVRMCAHVYAPVRACVCLRVCLRCMTLAGRRQGNGFGHGLAAAGRALAGDGGADALAVESLEEALALRAAGVSPPVASRSSRETGRCEPGCCNAQRAPGLTAGR